MSGNAVLENVRRYRAIASLYRQTAAFRPPQRLSLLEQAQEWERLALLELESVFFDTWPIDNGRRGVNGDSRKTVMVTR